MQKYAPHGVGSRRRGQAIVELIVALVVILALSAALLQLVSLARAHADAMVEAREEAGLLALTGPANSPGAEFLKDWLPGPDGSPITRDDIPESASPDGFQSLIVDKAAQAGGWPILAGIANDLPALHGNPDPVMAFGLVRGHASETVPVIPAVQSLLYQAPTIEVEGEAWLTRTGGIY